MFAIWLVKEYKNAVLNIESISTNWILSFLSLFIISTLYMYNQHSVYINRLLRYSEDILSHESVLPRCFSANLGFIHIFNTKCSTLTMVFEGNRWDLKYEKKATFSFLHLSVRNVNQMNNLHGFREYDANWSIVTPNIINNLMPLRVRCSCKF